VNEPSRTFGPTLDKDAVIFWAIAVPAAAVALAICISLVIWLVPATVPVQTERFLARTCARCKPEPREGIGYLAAIAAPIAVFWLVRLRFRHEPRWAGRSCASLAVWMRWIFVVAVVGVLLHQEFNLEGYLGRSWFIGTLACAVAWLTIRRRWVFNWPTQVATGSLLSRIATPAAVAATALALLPALYRADQPGILEIYEFHTGAQMDEFAAAVEGRTTLVDFFPLYQNLLPWLLAPGFKLFGLSIGSFSVTMSVLSLACLLVVYRVFCALTGSPAWGLALYLPFLVVSMVPLTDAHDRLHQQLNTFNYYAVGPLRYLGPYLLAGALSWYLARPGSVRLLTLFLFGGLAAINNLDFGLPALAAILVAVTLADRPAPAPTHLARILATALLGIGLAIGIFGSLTYLRSGAWPQLGMATFYHRAYAINGFQMLPMPACGLHWIIYVTMVAAIGRGLFDPGIGRHHRGLMLFSGIFGLGAFMYFVGRSHHNVLITIISAWAFAFSILIWRLSPQAIRPLGAKRCFPASLEFLVVLGVLSSIVQVRHLANPVEQLTRLRSGGGSHWAEPSSIIQFIRAQSHPGDRVIVSCHYGHVLALDAGVINVFPFSEPCAVVLKSQLDCVLAAIDHHQINKLFGSFDPEIEDALNARGFIPSAGVPGCDLWVKTSLASHSLHIR
jgi:hypothetical protein